MSATATKIEEAKETKETVKQVKLPDNAPPMPTMPYVELGMCVYWYPDQTRGNAPFAGYVTEISTNSLGLHVLARGGGYSIKEGVRFIDDKRRSIDDDNNDNQGYWEHTTLGRALIGFSDARWSYDAPSNSWK